MIKALLLLLGAILNQFAAWHFMDHVFRKKHDILGRFCFWIGIITVYVASVVALPLGYAAALPVNLLALFLLYRTTWRQVLFYATLLAALPAAIAGIIFPAAGCAFDGTSNGNLIAFAGSSALFTALSVALCQLTDRYEHPDTPHDPRFPLTALAPLGALPLLCGWMGAFPQLGGTSGRLIFAGTALVLFVIIILLLFSEWNSTAQLTAAQTLQAQVRKNAIDHDILRTAREQQERSAILIHDIRRNLSAIAALAESAENRAIVQYIASITQLDQQHRIRQYSGNRLVNDIVSRCCERCEKSGIKAEIEIRNADFTFLAESDLTAILDNLLENACEAAEKCEQERWLHLQIAERNVRYLVIKLENSSAEAPRGSGEELLTSKQDEAVHGYGTRIIRRTAQRYNGEVRFSYEQEHQTFSAIVLLQHP